MHFTWRSEKELGDKQIIFRDSGNKITLQDCVNSFKAKNPDWEYCFYNDEYIDNFVKTKYPYFYLIYKGLKKIEQIDLFRYMCLYEFGGVFLDTDCFCIRPLNQFLSLFPDAEIIAGEEFLHKSNWINYPPHIQLNLWSIFSTQHNYHIRNILAKAIGNCFINPETPVIEKTSMAPFGDYLYQAHLLDDKIKIVSTSFLSLDGRYEYMYGESYGCDNVPAFIIHGYHGSWIDEDFKKYAAQMEIRDNLLKSPKDA